VPLHGFGGGDHHRQRGRGQQRQRERRPDQRHHGGDGHGRHGHEEQRGERHRLAPKSPDAEAHPLQAGASGNEVEFHAKRDNMALRSAHARCKGM
jgi:hypothetical protein